MRLRRFMVNSAIWMLLALNIVVGTLIFNSVKPQCIIDGCDKPRCEQNYYCKKHTNMPVIKVKVCYGKR